MPVVYFSGVEQNWEIDNSLSVAYLVNRGGPVNLRVKISELEVLEESGETFSGKKRAVRR